EAAADRLALQPVVTPVALLTDLAGTDDGKVARALLGLRGKPDEAVALLKERLADPPVPIIDPQRVAQLVADLSSKQLLVRQGAHTELEMLGVLAEPALRKALQDPLQPPEVGQRIQAILSKLNPGPNNPPADPKQTPTGRLTARASVLLEEISTAPAKAV